MLDHTMNCKAEEGDSRPLERGVLTAASVRLPRRSKRPQIFGVRQSSAALASGGRVVREMHRLRRSELKRQRTPKAPPILTPAAPTSFQSRRRLCARRLFLRAEI